MQSIAKASGTKRNVPLLWSWRTMLIRDAAIKLRTSLRLLGDRFMRLNARSRAAVILRIGVISLCLLFSFVLGHPPAHPMPLMPRAISADTQSAQDRAIQEAIAIQEAKEWHQNQENWNSQTGTNVEKLSTRLSAVEQESHATNAALETMATILKIGFPAIGAMVTLATALQFRKKDQKV